jgi:hypothetical protein
VVQWSTTWMCGNKTEIYAQFVALCLKYDVYQPILRMNQVYPQLSDKLAIRVDESNPNHHLWNNNGTWWLHFTVYPTPVTAERRRFSLRTKCTNQARRRRDEILGSLASKELALAA